MSDGLARATPVQNLRLAATLFAPGVVRGTFILSPRGVALTTRLNTQRRLIRLLAGLRERHGGRPVIVRGPTGPTLLVLSRPDVERVLDGSDEVYAPATKEKLRAVGGFLDQTLLLSSGPERAVRHDYVSGVLDSGSTAHRLSASFRAAAREEAATLDGGPLGYAKAEAAWARVVRRCVYGSGARDDEELGAVLTELRRTGNWMGVRPPAVRRQRSWPSATTRASASTWPAPSLAASPG